MFMIVFRQQFIKDFLQMSMVIGVYLVLLKDSKLMLKFLRKMAALKGPLSSFELDAIADISVLVAAL